MPAILLSRQTKMTAAVAGQKTAISAVTGTPGKSWNGEKQRQGKSEHQQEELER
jgi:hypothetical protein